MEIFYKGTQNIPLYCTLLVFGMRSAHLSWSGFFLSGS